MLITIIIKQNFNMYKWTKHLDILEKKKKIIKNSWAFNKFAVRNGYLLNFSIGYFSNWREMKILCINY